MDTDIRRLITSAKEVMFASEFVCLFVSETTPIFIKFGGKVAHGPLDIFSGNPDHVRITAELWLRLGWRPSDTSTTLDVYYAAFV